MDGLFPYVVSIERKLDQNYVRVCSGIVIDENWILTAGHCVIENMALTVRYGNRSNESEVERVNILLRIQHPNYKLYKLPSNNLMIGHDIGLFKIEKIHVEQLAILSSQNYDRLLGLSVIFAGYGNTWNETEAASADEWKVKKLELNNRPLFFGEGIVSECDIIDPEQVWLCVDGKVSATRKGDSGGPLIYNDTVIGVHSGKLNNDMLYISVSPYLSWILKERYKHQSVVRNYDARLEFRLEII